MKTNFRKFFLLIGVLAALIGCVPSWNPLYTEKDLVFDDKLLGTWKDSDDKETWVFERTGEKSYRLTHTDSEGKKGKFDAHLLKLNARNFLDLYLTDLGEKGLECNSLAQAMLVPAHLFMRVDEIGDSLKLAAVDPEWVKKHLKTTPKAIAHRKLDDSVIFNAETKDLQAFVGQYAEGEGLFGAPFALKRLK